MGNSFRKPGKLWAAVVEEIEHDVVSRQPTTTTDQGSSPRCTWKPSVIPDDYGLRLRRGFRGNRVRSEDQDRE